MSNKFIVYFLFFYSFNRQKYVIKKPHRPQNSSPTQIDLRTKRDFFPVAYGWKGDCSYKKSRSHHYVFPLKFSLARKTCTLQSKRSIGDCIFPLPQAFQRGSIWIHLIGPFSEAPV